MFSILGFLPCQSKLPMNYKHLRQVERYQIYALMIAGHDQTQIAKLLDRTSMFMPTRPEAASFGRSCAATNKRESATPAPEPGNQKSL
jgi:hypothetical protein